MKYNEGDMILDDNGKLWLLREIRPDPNLNELIMVKRSDWEAVRSISMFSSKVWHRHLNDD